MYVWVTQAFGKRAGFMVSWFYWINNFFYYPAALTFITLILTAIIDPALASNKAFVCTAIIGFLWLSTLINLCGMHIFSKFSNLAGIFGVMLPILIVTILGFGGAWLGHSPVATDYTWHNLIPDFSSKTNISSLSILMFSMVGIELIPTMAGHVDNPVKTFPRATLISVILIACLYIVSTVALTLVLAPEKISASSGIIETLNLLGKELNMPFLLLIVGGMIVLGAIGSTGVWILAPITMLLESCKDIALPAWLTKTNKNGMPKMALLIQATVVTLIVVCTSFLPSIDTFFKTLAAMATITAFVPYIFMFMAFIALRQRYPHIVRPYRVPGNKVGGYVVAGLGLCSVLLAIALPFFSVPQDIVTFNETLLYYVELSFGSVVFALLGYLIYRYLGLKP